MRAIKNVDEMWKEKEKLVLDKAWTANKESSEVKLHHSVI